MARKTTTTTTTVRKKADVDTVAVDDNEGSGMTIEDGVVLTTTLALIGAIVLAYFAVQGMPGPMPA